MKIKRTLAAKLPAGELCYGLRRRHGITQSTFADLIGVDTITVSRWERGASEPPHLTYILLYILYHADQETLAVIKELKL